MTNAYRVSSQFSTPKIPSYTRALTSIEPLKPIDRLHALIYGNLEVRAILKSARGNENGRRDEIKTAVDLVDYERH